MFFLNALRHFDKIQTKRTEINPVDPITSVTQICCSGLRSLNAKGPMGCLLKARRGKGEVDDASHEQLTMWPGVEATSTRPCRQGRRPHDRLQQGLTAKHLPI